MIKDLSLIPIEDIYEELDKRFDTVVLLTSQERNEQELIQHHIKGNLISQIGLCELMSNTLKNSLVIDDVEEFEQD